MAPAHLRRTTGFAAPGARASRRGRRPPPPASRPPPPLHARAHPASLLASQPWSCGLEPVKNHSRVNGRVPSGSRIPPGARRVQQGGGHLAARGRAARAWPAQGHAQVAVHELERQPQGHAIDGGLQRRGSRARPSGFRRRGARSAGAADMPPEQRTQGTNAWGGCRAQVAAAAAASRSFACWPAQRRQRGAGTIAGEAWQRCGASAAAVWCHPAAAAHCGKPTIGAGLQRLGIQALPLGALQRCFQVLHPLAGVGGAAVQPCFQACYVGHPGAERRQQAGGPRGLSRRVVRGQHACGSGSGGGGRRQRRGAAPDRPPPHHTDWLGCRAWAQLIHPFKNCSSAVKGREGQT